MKQLLFTMFLLLFLQINCQERIAKPFFTTSIATTLAINENYTLNTDDGEPLLLPNSAMLRIGVGYQFNRIISASVHTGFDRHFSYNINAIPAYFTLRANIYEDTGDAYFIESSYGNMWRPSKHFSDGNYYGLGIGFQSVNSENLSTSFVIKYHRKAIIGFDNNRLDSLSLGFEFSFF